MGDIYSIRRRNFALLLALPVVARLDREQDKALLFDLSPSMWSQVKRPGYRIGDEMARELEAQAGVPVGWMDQSHSEGGVNAGGVGPRTASQIETFDDLILDAAKQWVRFEEGAGVQFQPVRRLERQLEIAKMIRDNGGSLSPQDAQNLIDAAREGGRK